MTLHAAMRGNRGSDRGRRAVERDGLLALEDLLSQLGRHHDPLDAVDLYSEGDRVARTQDRVRRHHRRFQILRVNVATADDDEVLEAAADEHLAVVADDPEVTRA